MLSETEVKAIGQELAAIEDWSERQLREYALIAEHGAVLAPVTFGRYQDGVEFFDPADAPDGCPWTFESNVPEHVIDTVFEPLATGLAKFVEVLKECCRAVVVRHDKGDWRLIYFLERTRDDAMCVLYPGGSDRCIQQMGGAPNPDPPAHLPHQIRAFAGVHDGFGESMPQFGVGCVMPTANMTVLRDDQPDWLEVFCDDVGNRIIAIKSEADVSMVADWDHETHQLSGQMPFFDWLNKRLTLRLLDLDPWDYPNGV